jgi:hypothetical protein
MSEFAVVLNQAMELPTSARADLAFRLLESLDALDNHPGANTDLASLILHREALVDSGNFVAYGVAEAKEILDRKIAERRAAS